MIYFPYHVRNLAIVSLCVLQLIRCSASRHKKVFSKCWEICLEGYQSGAVSHAAWAARRIA